ncbi:MAG: alpha/beta hydrolase [SAR202 cluster bacterium]|nr:alpha/beta hydrolase [SAR202 cluster bacterium]
MPDEAINGYRMHYEVHGQGPALVMLHGGLGGGEGCAPLVANHAQALAGRFTTVFLDRRGAGRSETPREGYSMQTYAQDLRCLLDRLNIRRAHVLGSSAGGPIAMRFALDFPGMTETLLLINTMSYVQEPERAVRQKELEALRSAAQRLGKQTAVEQALESRFPGLRQQDPARFQRLREINLEQFDGLAKTIQSYLDIRDSIEKRLGELAMPTLMVHGDADTRIPVACAHQLHQHIRNSRLHIIAGAEHGLLANEPEQVRKLMLEFLASVATGERTRAAR